jgi:hypothetical protein
MVGECTVVTAPLSNDEALTSAALAFNFLPVKAKTLPAWGSEP